MRTRATASFRAPPTVRCATRKAGVSTAYAFPVTRSLQRFRKTVRSIAKTAKGTAACGRIRLAEFAAPEFLQSAGGTLFFATHAAGKPRLVDPGSVSGPAVKFGMLEKSNVTIIEAMMEILAAQRAYEANAKGVTLKIRQANQP